MGFTMFLVDGILNILTLDGVIISCLLSSFSFCSGKIGFEPFTEGKGFVRENNFEVNSFWLTIFLSVSYLDLNMSCASLISR